MIDTNKFSKDKITDSTKGTDLIDLNLQLNGAKLCYSLNFPFDRFQDVAKTKEWLPILNSIRTDPELRVRIIQHKINRGHSAFLERVAA